VTLTLTLREAPSVPLEAEVLTPDRLHGLTAEEIQRLEVWHGNEPVDLGDFFTVAGDPDGDEVRVEGDLSRVKFIGAGMTSGRVIVDGDAGMHAGEGMQGGELVIEGDAGDWTGVDTLGGRLVVRGSVGRHLGGALPGARAGMRGGEILVHGDAGDEVGFGLRRGLIAVAGRIGVSAGLRMLAGTIVALGELGPHLGAEMRRGTVVAMARPALLPTYGYACTYKPPFVALCLRHLRALGLPVSDRQIDGRYARYSGDSLDLKRGEILILEDPA
jgi:formylmethanofuran dehydrogenase subunit C